MQQLTADGLTAELMTAIMDAEGGELTITKKLGTSIIRSELDGEDWRPTADSGYDIITKNAAAVRTLGMRFPALEITYPQTVLSEYEDTATEPKARISTRSNEAVIRVPEAFVQEHTGMAFQEMLQEKWQDALTDLVSAISKRLQKYEMRTASMFGNTPDVTISLRLTDDAVQTDIWTLPLRKCGFLPLCWDGEICGMALLLARRLKETLLLCCGDSTEIHVMRSDKQKLCVLMLHYQQRLE